MFRPFLTACLIAATTLPALALPDRPDDKERHREWKEEQKEDRRYWKERDKHERKYWRERERESREHRPHRYDDDDRDHGHGRRHIAPPWMNGYWRSGETRRYVALVPGDPSRMYVFLDGRWTSRAPSACPWRPRPSRHPGSGWICTWCCSTKLILIF